MGIIPDGKPIVMGILNCTPDSFFVGSRKQSDYDIAQRADEILSQGARIIDIGACSTRPGGDVVGEEEELKRMRNALTIVRRNHPTALLSIDTFRPSVAQMAVEEYGADMINDVSEGDLIEEMGRLHVPYILMSVQKDMPTMIEHFKKEVERLNQLGVKDIILDPGYGFGKDVIDGNYAVLREQKALRTAFPDLPILAGMSRKRMVWQLLGGTPQDVTALQGTMLANLVALQNGATILRVHDVREAIDTIKIYDKVKV